MFRPNLIPLFASLATVLMSIALPTHAASQSNAPVRNYAVRQQWDIGASSRWDYLNVDPVRHRLYVTRGQRVQVIDPDSGQTVGEIPGTNGVHGVAFAQDLKLGFTSNGMANTVSVFDLDTLNVKREVPVGGSNPDAILYIPKAHKLYTFNGKSNDVSVFDAADMHLRTRIPVGGTPEFAVSDSAGHIFLNIEDKSEIVEIDENTDAVLAHWPLTSCDEPSGMAIDASHNRLFSVCSNKVMAVTDSVTGKPVARIAIGARPDAAAYDARTGTVFSSNGDGTLSVIRQRDADHYEVVATVQTQKGARTMAFDSKNGHVYLPVGDEHKFNVLVVSP